MVLLSTLCCLISCNRSSDCFLPQLGHSLGLFHWQFLLWFLYLYAYKIEFNSKNRFKEINKIKFKAKTISCIVSSLELLAGSVILISCLSISRHVFPILEQLAMPPFSFLTAITGLLKTLKHSFSLAPGALCFEFFFIPFFKAIFCIRLKVICVKMKKKSNTPIE